MLVAKRMSKNPVTVCSEDHLSTAHEKMQQGGFRRVPVVDNGRIVGILSERDLRQHLGFLEQTKVNAAMTPDPVTVRPQATLEEAAQILLKRKFGALPVVEGGKVEGIITTSDILQAFLDVMGVSTEGTFRIDLVPEGEGFDLSSASKAIGEEGGEVLGLGTYREKWEDTPVFYLRLRSPDPDRIADRLKERGFTVLGIRP